MLWYDSCIIALTFWKAIQVRRDVAGGLLAVILRDGMCPHVSASYCALMTSPCLGTLYYAYVLYDATRKCTERSI